ncbi:MAG: murein biosynthesis integral membrane protein MurJ [Candidatus Omnitrophota bacterium]|nr:murein biosynthesis integral membrane protein MurJ [Candidatus Omnitrophota bacterium]
MSDGKSLVKSAGVIGLSTFASRILGLLRDVFSASLFGTGLVWDAFLIAFMIPNLMRRLLGEGALSGSFIPVFTEYLEKKPRREAWKLVSIIFTLLVLGLLMLVLSGIWMIGLALNNFSLSAKIVLILRLTRIMLPYLFFISLSALSMGILNSFKHFTLPALGPVILNACWIGALFWLCPRFGPALEQKILGLTIGILFGGAAQLAIQIPVLIKKGFNRFSIRLDLNLSHPGVRRVGYLMAPAILGLAVTQINVVVDIILGLMLGDGAISALYYGNRLMQLPLGIFGIAMGTVALPTMAVYAAKNEIEKLKKTLSLALRMVFFITIPAAVGLIILRLPIMETLFQHGNFTSLSASRAADTLLFYSLGLFSYAGVKIVVPCFYSLQDTKTPVKIGIIALLSNIILNLILMRPLKESGLAMATAISSMINLSILFLVLRRKIGSFGARKIVYSFGRILCSAMIMGIFCYLVSKPVFRLTGLSAQLIGLLSVISGGIIIFITCSFIFKVEELKTVSRWILRKS